jgi:hypothetical protein
MVTLQQPIFLKVAEKRSENILDKFMKYIFQLKTGIFGKSLKVAEFFLNYLNFPVELAATLCKNLATVVGIPRNFQWGEKV